MTYLNSSFEDEVRPGVSNTLQELPFKEVTVFALVKQDCQFACHFDLDSKIWFSVLITAFEHDRVAASTQRNFRARNAVNCSNVFPESAENNPGVL